MLGSLSITQSCTGNTWCDLYDVDLSIAATIHIFFVVMRDVPSWYNCIVV